jgi:peptidoglycan/LPS O-acetylase OafA/YrhL
MSDEQRVSPRKIPRWPALDGMRAVGVVSVMFFHMNRPYFFPGGYLGVDVFFVLSGFLITSLIVGEWESNFHRVHLGMFYARRASRLLPALIAVIVACTIGVLTYDRLAPLRHGTLTSIPWSLFYIENWRQALPQVNAPFNALGLLAHTWSLSIEEQFYIVWPVALLLLLSKWGHRRVRLAGAVLALAVAEMVYRFAVLNVGWSVTRVYNGTDLHSDGLLVGCALALALSTEPILAKMRERRRAVGYAGLVSGVLVVVLILTSRNTHDWAYWGSIPLTNILTGVVVLAVVTSYIPLVSRFLTSRPLVWTGRRSYGLYLWHLPIYGFIGTINSFAGNRTRPVEFVVSFLVAAISYRFIEAPFLRFKDRRFSVGERLPTAELDALDVQLHDTSRDSSQAPNQLQEGATE